MMSSLWSTRRKKFPFIERRTIGEVNSLKEVSDKERHVLTKYFEGMGLSLWTAWLKIGEDESKKSWRHILMFWQKLLGMKCAYTKVYRIGRIYGCEEDPRVKDLQRSLMGLCPESGWTIVHQTQFAIALALKRWVYYNAINILGNILSMSEFCICFQFSSVTQSCPTLCHPMNRSMPGLPVHQQLPEFTQTHVHWVGDAIQPSHPLYSPSPPAPNPSHHQSLFQWVNSSHKVAKVLEFQL